MTGQGIFVGRESTGGAANIRASGRTLPRNGARRDRTADLLRATQALSQLSYGPVSENCRRSSPKVGRPVDKSTLVVLILENRADIIVASKGNDIRR